jgi:guanylate cyclase
MFVLSPDVKNMKELHTMGLTLSDLPLLSFQREAVFLGEHVASEINSAFKFDKISKQLEIERKLSDALLDQMLPRKVAEELRRGKTPAPEAFSGVTIFFSDIVGFTSISSQLPPNGVVTFLNNLYIVMDVVVKRFGLYKVETIGDAFMVCSGLPTVNENHARDVANFAVAVREAVKSVVNPLDNQPIQLRIGVHTGEVMAG